MKREQRDFLKKKICEFEKSQQELFLKAKNGFHYRCKIFSVHDESFMILDKIEALHSFGYEDIAELDLWKGVR